MKKYLIVLIIIGVSHSQNYRVNISVEDGDIYSINYGLFYVKLYAYKYPYGDSVILKYNGYGGEICWEEENYNYYSNSYEIDYDCHMIQDTYVEKSCYGCITKDGESIDAVLTPVSLSDVVN